MRPLSRGYVEAKSNGPGDMPAITPRYLSEESDRRAIIGSLRLARRIFAAPALNRSSARRACRACRFRRRTNWSITHGAMAVPAITQLYLYDGLVPNERRRRRIARTASTACGLSTPR
jgi:choline dehydrogenase-like flavoprotein